MPQLVRDGEADAGRGPAIIKKDDGQAVAAYGKAGITSGGIRQAKGREQIGACGISEGFNPCAREGKRKGYREAVNAVIQQGRPCSGAGLPMACLSLPRA